MGRLRQNAFLARYLDDAVYRTKINLYVGVAVNFVYIFIKLVTGVVCRSEWLIVFALYYVVLTALRVSLVNYLRRGCLRPDPGDVRLYDRARNEGIEQGGSRP